MNKPFYQDSQITEYHGHTPDVLKELPPESVHMVVTSIPYWGLRNYGLEPQVWDYGSGLVKCEHEWGENLVEKKRGSIGDKQTYEGGRATQEHQGTSLNQGQFCQKCNAWRGSLGLEPTPELFIQHIVQVFGEVRRVLRKDGTVFLNIGDSYSGSGGEHKHDKGQSGLTDNRDKIGFVGPKSAPGLKPKDLVMIPARVALALQADGWWLRSDIIWAKPNPMPESCTDRPTNSHEHVFLLAKSAKYFYDNEAVKEKSITDDNRKPYAPGQIDNRGNGHDRNGGEHTNRNTSSRNLRNVWTIATEPTPEAHFATFPSKLCEIAIKAGTSEKGCCPGCGGPWVRVVEKTKSYQSNAGKAAAESGIYDLSNSGSPRTDVDRPEHDIRFGPCVESKTIGWKPSCECDQREGIISDAEDPRLAPYAPIPCTVLDPFSGSGRTLIVAKTLGRKAIGIDLKAEYLKMPLSKLAQERLI